MYIRKAVLKGARDAAANALRKRLNTLETAKHAAAAIAAVAGNAAAMDELQNEVVSQKKQTGLLFKILIPVLIVAVVAGIYLFKNADKNKDVDYASSEFDLDATKDFDLDKLLSYGLPVIIDFGADSCIPCKEMAPVLQKLNKELRGKAIVKFVDVWKNPDAAGKVPLSVIPTQFFFDKHGKPYEPEYSIKIKKHYSRNAADELLFTAHEGGLKKEEMLEILKELGVE